MVLDGRSDAAHAFDDGPLLVQRIRHSDQRAPKVGGIDIHLLHARRGELPDGALDRRPIQPEMQELGQQGIAAMKPNQIGCESWTGLVPSPDGCLAHVLPAVRAIEQDIVALEPEAIDGMGGRILHVGQVELAILDVVHPENGDSCAAIAQGQVGSVLGSDDEAPEVFDRPCSGPGADFRINKVGRLAR